MYTDNVPTMQIELDIDRLWGNLFFLGLQSDVDLFGLLYYQRRWYFNFPWP
jgi:hypothetical protein